MKNSIKALLLSAGLLAGAKTLEGVTLKGGFNWNNEITRSVLSLSQQLTQRGNLSLVGEVEKESGKPLALQGSLTQKWGANSLIVALKEGLDENADPFNPAYLYPGVFYGRTFGKFGASVGVRGYFPKEGKPGYCAAVSGKYKIGKFGIETGVLVPIHNWQLSVKPLISYEF